LYIKTLYYESIKPELKTRPINECRCDERLKTKAEESTRLAYVDCVFDFFRFLFFVFLVTSQNGEEVSRGELSGKCEHNIPTQILHVIMKDT
jgi:hypothetical protein